MAGRLRIISGSAGGIPLKVPDGAVRPTSDRVRESMFAILGTVVEDAACLDLYAGSGALGIEALSRGAASCQFVDHAQAACDAVEENLGKARLTGGRVRRAEIGGFLRKHRGSYDLVFADPPYAAEETGNLAAALVSNGALVELMEPGAILVVESRRVAGKCPADERLELLDAREYGETLVSFFRRRDGDH